MWVLRVEEDGAGTAGNGVVAAGIGAHGVAKHVWTTKQVYMWRGTGRVCARCGSRGSKRGMLGATAPFGGRAGVH